MDTLIPKVVARFLQSARNIRVAPLPMEKCPACQGAKVLTDSAFDLKTTCTRCLGTGIDPNSFEALKKDVKDIEDRYTVKHKKFQEDKKEWGPGRSRLQFGLGQGRDLQTLGAKKSARQEQLRKENARWDTAKKLARAVGAAA